LAQSALLLAVAAFGLIKKGARRWLNLGVVIQPSEIMKIAMPLMLAWYFQKREGVLKTWDYAIAGCLLALPVFLIARQPDLGTALLVLAAGLYVIILAGFPWRWIIPVVVAAVIGIILIISFGNTICTPEMIWPLVKEYQKHRICTLLDPSSDPLGKGFHTIQAIIAIGSGGLFGKGWQLGTQAHLEFIPEKHFWTRLATPLAKVFIPFKQLLQSAREDFLVKAGSWARKHTLNLFPKNIPILYLRFTRKSSVSLVISFC